jgi:hypothetical protein
LVCAKCREITRIANLSYPKMVRTCRTVHKKESWSNHSTYWCLGYRCAAAVALVTTEENCLLGTDRRIVAVICFMLVWDMMKLMAATY